MPNRNNQETGDFEPVDSIVFVSEPNQPPLSAVAVLNILTNNLTFQDNLSPYFDDGQSALTRFRPPLIESINNGDDLFLTFTAEDLSVSMTMFFNADGTENEIRIVPLLIDPADFAALAAPADRSNPADFDLAEVFALYGFEPANPFAGLSVPDDISFGSLDYAGFGGFADLFVDFDRISAGGFGFGFGDDFGFGSGGGGFYDDITSGFTDTDFSGFFLG